MPGKKKGKKKSRSSKSSGKEKSATGIKRLLQETPDLDSIVIPPTPRDRLVNLLQKTEVKEKEIFDVKVSVKVLQSLSTQDIKELKELFEILDVRKTGNLNVNDLRRGLWILGFRPSRDDVVEMLRDTVTRSTNPSPSASTTTSLSRTVTSSQKPFLSGCDLNLFLEIVIDYQSSSRDRLSELQTAFGLFDLENTGLVTLETLSQLNKTHGAGLTEDEVKELLEFADLKGDGVLDMQEFVKTMAKTNIYDGVA